MKYTREHIKCHIQLLYFSEQNNKNLTKTKIYNKCRRLMESSTEEVGLRLSVFSLNILPGMIRDE